MRLAIVLAYLLVGLGYTAGGEELRGCNRADRPSWPAWCSTDASLLRVVTWPFALGRAVAASSVKRDDP